MASYEEFEQWHATRNEAADMQPGVKVKPEVTFLMGGGDAGLTVLPPAPLPTVKARVIGNHRIVCGGIFTGGDVFDAPHNDETRLWLKQGYIELVPETLVPETTKKEK
jgi:hypothetical protein